MTEYRLFDAASAIRLAQTENHRQCLVCTSKLLRCEVACDVTKPRDVGCVDLFDQDSSSVSVDFDFDFDLGSKGR